MYGSTSRSCRRRRARTNAQQCVPRLSRSARHRAPIAAGVPSPRSTVATAASAAAAPPNHESSAIGRCRRRVRAPASIDAADQRLRVSALVHDVAVDAIAARRQRRQPDVEVERLAASAPRDGDARARRARARAPETCASACRDRAAARCSGSAGWDRPSSASRIASVRRRRSPLRAQPSRGRERPVQHGPAVARRLGRPPALPPQRISAASHRRDRHAESRTAPAPGSGSTPGGRTLSRTALPMIVSRPTVRNRPSPASSAPRPRRPSSAARWRAPSRARWRCPCPDGPSTLTASSYELGVMNHSSAAYSVGSPGTGGAVSGGGAPFEPDVPLPGADGDAVVARCRSRRTRTATCARPGITPGSRTLTRTRKDRPCRRRTCRGCRRAPSTGPPARVAAAARAPGHQRWTRAIQLPHHSPQRADTNPSASAIGSPAARLSGGFSRYQRACMPGRRRSPCDG